MSLRTTFALITAAAVVSVGVCCRTAAAANDAGTQSVFAYGVGDDYKRMLAVTDLGEDISVYRSEAEAVAAAGSVA